MYALKNLVVALDLSKLDETLLQYTFQLSTIINTGKIILVHVAKPDSLKKAVNTHGILVHQKEKLLQVLQEKIEPFRSEPSFEEILIQVKAGEPAAKILEVAYEHKADLIITGRKNLSEGKGHTPKKLIRKALCSVLCLPENATANFSKVLIPVDFSSESKLALEGALPFARKTGMQIECLHIYTVPHGYHTCGKTQEEFAKIMHKNAERRYKCFIKDLDLKGIDISCRYQLDPGHKGPKIIFNIALVEGADLIMMSSKGRTGMAAAFLESTSEKLFHYNFGVPTLVFKNKEHNLTFFEAILKI
ncbi:universal stress protein [Rapidithrix thailandica]|uniref:Universal stress protein n=1 Tax=Rapidithrix thailandica TaxID=413964 RepID=A0AAW9S3I4_9BACT